MHFEPNQGQTAREVEFLARGPGYVLFLTADELVMTLRQGASDADGKPWRNSRKRSGFPDKDTLSRPGSSASAPTDGEHRLGATLRFGFTGANPTPEITGIDPLGGHSNYFIDNDPTKWRTSIPHFARVQVNL